MTKMKVVLFSLFIIISQSLFGQTKVGTSAAPFLGIPIGTAATAMGGSYVSMVNDASALYWNPGVISRFENTEISFMNADWFLDSKYTWGAIIFNIGNDMAAGVQIAYLDYGQEEVTTIYKQDGTGEFWEAHDLMIGLSLAKSFTEKFSLGGTFKYVEQKIYNEAASSVAFDIGLLFITGFQGMRLGMSISNFGSDMQLDGKDLFHTYDSDPDNLGNNHTVTSKKNTDKWPIPLVFRVGLSMEVIEFSGNVLSISTDSVVPSDNSSNINVGAQVAVMDAVYLRAGYQALGLTNNESGITAGIGVKYFVPGLSQIKLDYAFGDYGIIDDVHIIGFSLSL